MKKYLILPAVFFLSFLSVQAKQKPSSKPNVVIIYVDDLGYGDVGYNGAIGVKTPNVDRLAKEGLVFTDAHTSDATCSPSRFSLLTGEYAFREHIHVLPGNVPLKIKPGSATLASVFKDAGYRTAVIGKWHLGLGDDKLNWNGPIKPGPLEIGFDYSFLIPATADRVPCVFVENHHVVGLNPGDSLKVSYRKKIGNDPTGKDHPEYLRMKAYPGQGHNNTIVNGVGRIGYMSGGHTARWVDELFPDILTTKAEQFITRNKDKPFFLYFAFSDIHVPRLPNPRFLGKSTMGNRGDAIAQMDWCTGQIIKTLKDLGLAKNTLVIFSSDNGPVLNDGYEDRAVELLGKHKPWGPFSGGKYSILEAGTRVPFITWWPSMIKPGVSHALISQVDLVASFAALAGTKLRPEDAPDSYNILPVLLGQRKKGRENLVESARTQALRSGNWKYISPHAGPPLYKAVNIKSGLSMEPQLYNLNNDPGEQHNLAGDDPIKVEKMKSVLDKIKKDGYSRPGYGK